MYHQVKYVFYLHSDWNPHAVQWDKTPHDAAECTFLGVAKLPMLKLSCQRSRTCHKIWAKNPWRPAKQPNSLDYEHQLYHEQLLFAFHPLVILLSNVIERRRWSSKSFTSFQILATNIFWPIKKLLIVTNEILVVACCHVECVFFGKVRYQASSVQLNELDMFKQCPSIT